MHKMHQFARYLFWDTTLAKCEVKFESNEKAECGFQ